MWNVHSLRATQEGIRIPVASADYHSTRSRQDIRVMQKLCFGTQVKWYCLSMNRSSKIEPSVNYLAHRGPAVNGILPRLTNTCYLTLNNASSGYHNLELDKKNHIQQHLHFNLVGSGKQDYHLA